MLCGRLFITEASEPCPHQFSIVESFQVVLIREEIIGDLRDILYDLGKFFLWVFEPDRLQGPCVLSAMQYRSFFFTRELEHNNLYMREFVRRMQLTGLHDEM